MNKVIATELAGWIGLVHPEILEEFHIVKKFDPKFLTVPPSHRYFNVKKEIDELLKEHTLDFTMRNFVPQYKSRIGYYYKEQLAFIYDCTCIDGGHLPHLTYWDDFFRRDNEFKERIGSEPDCHYVAMDDKKIIKTVKKILGQIEKYQGTNK